MGDFNDPAQYIEQEREKDFWKNLAGGTVHAIDQLAFGLPSTIARKAAPAVNEAVFEVGSPEARKAGDIVGLVGSIATGGLEAKAGQKLGSAFLGNILKKGGAEAAGRVAEATASGALRAGTAADEAGLDPLKAALLGAATGAVPAVVGEGITATMAGLGPKSRALVKAGISPEAVKGEVGALTEKQLAALTQAEREAYFAKKAQQNLDIAVEQAKTMTPGAPALKSSRSYEIKDPLFEKYFGKDAAKQISEIAKSSPQMTTYIDMMGQELARGDVAEVASKLDALISSTPGAKSGSFSGVIIKNPKTNVYESTEPSVLEDIQQALKNNKPEALKNAVQTARGMQRGAPEAWNKFMNRVLAETAESASPPVQIKDSLRMLRALGFKDEYLSKYMAETMQQGAKQRMVPISNIMMAKLGDMLQYDKPGLEKLLNNMNEADVRDMFATLIEGGKGSLNELQKIQKLAMDIGIEKWFPYVKDVAKVTPAAAYTAVRPPR